MTVVLPDPLIWQSGTLYGLHALAAAEIDRSDLTFFLVRDGRLLEEANVLVSALGLYANARYVKKLARFVHSADILLVPRLMSDQWEFAQLRPASKQTLITSDERLAAQWPRAELFGRRDWKRAAVLLAERQSTC